MDHKELEDRILLKELVDTISILGDKKDFKNQVQFFSENALSETIFQGKTILKLEGRKTMASTFAKFLGEIDTVYHFNGQHLVTINGDTARGTCYCLITLIGNENGKKMMNRIGAIYEDDYIRIDNHWFIAKRVGTFDWQEKNEVNQ
ncbi:nuclear transport factor 2 family protein [[Flexibacter] sp. ATCC 35103]|uniref:nuclear transport factor 2 family protein n=1 Tax=[Flexibacter] sp. ATCC 35103 TaxID=1937528 RepID=UPI0009C9ABBF|nr:nuclear transport factor 2 family protein [[Flexibacter] sp. ATCC 35103]OMQ12962.1 bile acid 7-alpha-dehydratase [[Flexibacter] sp. ATCC 35103]